MTWILIGLSVWLTIALIYRFTLWIEVEERSEKEKRKQRKKKERSDLDMLLALQSAFNREDVEAVKKLVEQRDGPNSRSLLEVARWENCIKKLGKLREENASGEIDGSLNSVTTDGDNEGGSNISVRVLID